MTLAAVARWLGNKVANSDRMRSSFSEAALPIMEKLVATGEATDQCLKHGFMPISVRSRHSFAEIEEGEKRRLWDELTKLLGIDAEPEKFLEFFMLLAHEYARDGNWPNALGEHIATDDRLWSLFRELAIPIAKKMAVTGDSTDKCLEHGFLPVPIHFYQPIPDLEEMERRKAWDRVSSLRGIAFEPEKYLEFFKLLAHEYAHECDWPNEPTGDSWQFHLHNGCFSYGCAASLHCLIRHNKPRRIIEIGSGNSSKVIAAAIKLNNSEKIVASYSIIDPYSSINPNDLPANVELICKPVESIDVEFFQSLMENDFLFIDSSHVSKIGSDVNFEILDILPLINKGVFVHFHDIHLPYEYPKFYATTPDCRMFWTEAYLLQAFLSCNNDFEIVLPVDYMQRNYNAELKQIFPHSNKTDFGWVSGSFWIKRVAKTH